jgi:hypothetical protein
MRKTKDSRGMARRAKWAKMYQTSQKVIHFQTPAKYRQSQLKHIPHNLEGIRSLKQEM